VLATFAQDLGDDIGRVTVVLMTEFGRTFRENGGGGVDHGRASTMMVMRGRIRGSLYGDWPGLNPTDIDGNALRVTVDYRSVLADILEHRLATGDMATVLPGYVDTPDKRLGFALPSAPSPDLPQQDAFEVDGVLVFRVRTRPTCAECSTNGLPRCSISNVRGGTTTNHVTRSSARASSVRRRNTMRN